MTLAELREWLLANTTERQTVCLECHFWANNYSFERTRGQRIEYRAAVWVSGECRGYQASSVDELYERLVAAEPGWKDAEISAALAEADALAPRRNGLCGASGAIQQNPVEAIS